MSIRIIKHGLLDTLQDEGRYGFQHLGINPGGAMDNIAASVANILVGNEPSEAVIEMHFPASTYYFEKPAVIALCGADFSATINGKEIPSDTAIIVAANSTLSFKKYVSGARIYLAVQGGFSAELWLNSYSTNLKTNAGGFNGRSLKKDDILHTRAEQFAFTSLPEGSVIVTPIHADIKNFYTRLNPIRCTQGKDFENLELNSKQKFVEKEFSISRQSDRMGYRLEGEKLECIDTSECISSAVTKGSIQLLPNGQLIILMADHQTTGGYPVVAHAISTDIPKLAQMKAGSRFQFKLIGLETAEDLYLQQQRNLQQIQEQCNLQLQQFFS